MLIIVTFCLLLNSLDAVVIQYVA